MSKRVIESEVTGSVWKIVAQIGDLLEAEGTLMVLESMKMEIPIQTEDGGRLLEVLVQEGDAVREGQALAVMEN